jgi:hypothetical protein
MPIKCICSCCHAPFTSGDAAVFVASHPGHEGLCAKCYANPAWKERLRTYGEAPVPPGKSADGECECP